MPPNDKVDLHYVQYRNARLSLNGYPYCCYTFLLFYELDILLHILCAGDITLIHDWRVSTILFAVFWFERFILEFLLNFCSPWRTFRLTYCYKTSFRGRAFLTCDILNAVISEHISITGILAKIGCLAPCRVKWIHILVSSTKCVPC